MSPELPYLAAGAVAIAGGTAKAGKFPPPEAVRALFGTILLVILASATANSKAAPVVHAVGLLVLLGAMMAAVPAFARAQVKKSKK